MKDIPGFEGRYAVTEEGKVWSHAKNSSGGHAGKFLRPSKRNGYNRVRLCINNECKTKLIHRLVALTYIPNPENKTFINHINGVKNDNCVENLEWCTAFENQKHSWDILGRKVTDNQRKASVINGLKNGKKVMQLTKEGILCRVYDSCTEAERITGLPHGNISRCSLGRKHFNTCGGYVWKFV